MGNLLLRIFLAVTVMILIVLAIGTWLPRDYETTATIRIDAPTSDVFPQINRLRAWSNWSNWNTRDIPSLEVEYGGNDAGEGAVQRWTEPRGSGKLWITKSVENERVEYQSEFANFPVMTSSIRLESSDGGTRVVWTSSGALPGGPFYGWFSPTFSKALQGEYDKALNKLKTLVESQIRQEEGAAEIAAPRD